MLTYTPSTEALPPKADERPWALFLLCMLWLLPGMIGHNPWKPDEPHSVGIVYGMLRDGNWWVPRLAGLPVLEDGPLYFQLSAFLARLTAGWLAVHDAARVVATAFVALALTFCGGIGRELGGRRYGRVVVVLMIGCLGLLVLGHTATNGVAAFCGFAAAFYGMSLFARNPLWAGVALGGGAAVSAMSASLFEPIVLTLIALALPLCFRHWRSQRYAITGLTALVTGGPAMLLWFLGLRASDPAMFAQWLAHGAWFRFDGFAHPSRLSEISFYLRTLPWFAWPAWPLAVWTLWDSRLTGYARPPVQFSLLVLGIMLSALALSPAVQDDYLLPLLIPCSVLAAIGIDRLRHGAAAALNWFGVMTFGMLGLYIWLGWTAAMTGIPPQLARRGDTVIPGFHARFSWFELIVGALLTAAWVWAVSRRRQMGRQAVSSWAAGLALCWSLLMLLWLPAIDWVKGYQKVAVELAQALPGQYDCIAAEGMSPEQATLFAYHGNVALKPDAAGQCQLLLVQGTGDEVAPQGDWRKIWEGARPGDRRERFRLYQRFTPASIRL
ncbi:hypothetical protein ABWL39_07020 [Chitinivorax sp. PXF-14]|uniref:ArnT family glycosyltransferase n=1 Tax=Chitinivorax sp. PXF-14 TaxID=3230488 RepID=UPI003467B867